MSNRLLQIGRVPLIPDPFVAVKASSAFSQSRTQTDQVFALGRAFRELPRDIWNVVAGYARTIEDAIRISNISQMNDHRLSDIGLRRDQIPMLFVDRRIDTLGLSAKGQCTFYL